MDRINPLKLRERLVEKRKQFSFLPFYAGPYEWDVLCKREIEKGNNDSKLFAFHEDLKEYLYFGLNFLKEQADIRDATEASFVIQFCKDAFEDNYCENKDEILPYLLSYYGDGEDYLPHVKMALLYDTILGYSVNTFYWRGKPYAKTLFEELKRDSFVAAVWGELGDFYKSVLDLDQAVEVFLTGAKLFLKDGQKKEAATLYRRGYAVLRQLGDPLPSEEEIRTLYGEEADQILKVSAPTYKHDPVERTKAFQEAYDEVMEEAVARYIEEGSPTVLLLWSYMREGLAARGIVWNAPNRMNPSMRFD